MATVFSMDVFVGYVPALQSIFSNKVSWLLAVEMALNMAVPQGRDHRAPPCKLRWPLPITMTIEPTTSLSQLVAWLLDAHEEPEDVRRGVVELDSTMNKAAPCPLLIVEFKTLCATAKAPNTVRAVVEVAWQTTDSRASRDTTTL